MRSLIAGIALLAGAGTANAASMVRDAVGCITIHATDQFYTIHKQNPDKAWDYFREKERYGLCTKFQTGDQVVVAQTNRGNTDKCVMKGMMRDCVWVSKLNVK